ncbi:UvrD-helicase domain-containing protein [Aquipuribacter nitratireducens]|uniref:RecBCD enzyme subunit RecB n=1 Tax=Aquipuribacter nitratireducens TaxID=650104 RepID=A0ABW0GJP2_9MICO
MSASPLRGLLEPDPEPFDLEGPLPVGTSVLEASAGTGKTFTIARLVSRYVAEQDVPVDRLLVVSFSRESSRELRERVRGRLVEDRGDAAAAGADDRVDRLERALADFDGATVTTTHAFCHAMLRELGTAADHDRDAVLVEDPSDLVAEVADDLYVRKWGAPGAEDRPALDVDTFRRLAREVGLDLATPLVPDPSEAADEATRLRVRVAAAVRAEVARRTRAGRLLTYDDMVLRLDDALTDPATAAVAAARMRSRFTVVLVDEFQDTDPVQWRILRRAFHGHATLVLVGDPKQAIYGFRGADVAAYLDARAATTGRATLPRNHRSDPGLVRGLAGLLGGAALGDERIRVRPVTAAHDGQVVDGPAVGAPVELRVLRREGLAAHDLTGAGLVTARAARAAVQEDCARRVVELLDGTTLTPRGGTARPLHPGDVAVVVRYNSEALAIQARLREAGVPAVVSGRTSVFATEAAEEWQRLLEALEQPHRTTRVRRLGVGRLVGLTAADLDGDAPAVDDLALRLRGWGRVHAERGVAALFERVQSDLRVQERLLAQPDGERVLTDLRHVAEVLHEEAVVGDLGLTALASWLCRRRSEGTDATVERSRRLETDADAVQVLTSHTSKGLEFAVVLAPSLWNHYTGRPPLHPLFHDRRGVRTRDVGGPTGPDFGEHVRLHQDEEAAEELRLAYVTLTRAQGKVVTWWCPTTNTPSSPLQRLLLHDDPGTVAPFRVPVPSDAEAVRAFHSRAATTGAALDVLPVPAPGSAPVGTWQPPPRPTPRLALARLDRAPDAGWRRTSYSALTHAAHEAVYGLGPGPGGPTPAPADEPETGRTDDEPDAGPGTLTGAPVPRRGDAGATADAHLLDVPSLWHDLAGGTGFGTLVHLALERYEPGGDVAALVGRLAQGGADVPALVRALDVALATPLGPLADGLAWAQVPVADRLPELDFELPLAGGDRPDPRHAAGATLAGLVALWREHVPSGRLAGYADALEQLPVARGEATLRGYLAGSVDAVVRVGAPGAERYLVVDHKTNRLAPREEALTAWHYRSEALEHSMVEAHYPLQALLYAAALHRYLRWRRPGYDPEQHLGGVLYLFLRGMSGPGVLDDAGEAPGVLAWRPPTALVVGLSDLLAGGAG